MILWIIVVCKDLLLWWLYVDFYPWVRLVLKKIVVFVIIIIIFGLVLSRMGLCSRLAWLRR
jgi:hypothetical protein